MNRPRLSYPYEWRDSKVIAIDNLLEIREACRKSGIVVVTTNGCFDILHNGHVRFLNRARELGDLLIVAVNSDESVKIIKGAGQPFVNEMDRAEILAAIRSVDHVVVFDELIPMNILSVIQPDIHCKAANYVAEGLPETPIVEGGGGRIRILALEEAYSTSGLVAKIATQYGSPTILSKLDIRADEKMEFVINWLLNGSNLLRQIAYRLSAAILEAARILDQALAGGNKIMICGNGESAAVAQHFSADLIARFRRFSSSQQVILLKADSSEEHVFSELLFATGERGDVLITISTRGESPNILTVVEMAETTGILTIALCGANSLSLSRIANLCIAVPSDDVAYIQQAHLAIVHLLYDLIDRIQHFRRERNAKA